MVSFMAIQRGEQPDDKAEGRAKRCALVGSAGKRGNEGARRTHGKKMVPGQFAGGPGCVSPSAHQ